MKLGDRNGAIGPSFFMRTDLDEARPGLIWQHEIVPYLEDHYFDQPDRLAGFAISKLMASPAEVVVSPPATQTTPIADGDADPAP